MSYLWLQISSLTGFFSNLTDGNFFIQTSLTRKKTNQRLRVNSRVEYLNLQIQDKQLMSYTITDKPEQGTKLISKQASKLVKHSRSDYKKLHEALQQFLNSQLPQ